MKYTISVPFIKLTERPKHKFQEQDVCAFPALLFTCRFLNSVQCATRGAKIETLFTCTYSFIRIMQWRADLIGRQDPEGGDDLLSSVGVGCLPGHEVNEGLEGDRALSVGVHQGHDACKLHFALRPGA